MKAAALLLLLPMALYLGCFALHFMLLPRTGSGAAFMTPRFRATLEGDEYSAARLAQLVAEAVPTKYGVLHDASLPNFWQKFAELNGEMYRANQVRHGRHAMHTYR